MTLTTKLDIGQKVWFMYENKAVKAQITDITISRDSCCTVVRYTTKSEATCQHTFYETRLNEEFFLTKEELLKSL